MTDTEGLSKAIEGTIWKYMNSLDVAVLEEFHKEDNLKTELAKEIAETVLVFQENEKAVEREPADFLTVAYLNRWEEWADLTVAAGNVWSEDLWESTCDAIDRTLEDYFGGIDVWNASPRADFIRLLAWNILSNQEV